MTTTQRGGPGVGIRHVARIVSAVGEGDPSVALLLANTAITHTAQATVGGWSTVHCDDLLRRSLQRPTFVNSVRAEPELGAPARSGIPATTITRTSDGWRLDGNKAYGTAVSALGNPGLTRHNGLERHLRNALCVRVHPPQKDAALLAAGRRILAESQKGSA